jgi:hypothetical protein
MIVTSRQQEVVVTSTYLNTYASRRDPMIPASFAPNLLPNQLHEHMRNIKVHTHILAQRYCSIRHYFHIQPHTCQLPYSPFNVTVYRPARVFSSTCVNWTVRFRKPRHVPKAAKMPGWTGNWSRPTKHQATPAPYYLLPGGEDTPYCKTCGRVIGELYSL